MGDFIFFSSSSSLFSLQFLYGVSFPEPRRVNAQSSTSTLGLVWATEIAHFDNVPEEDNN